MNGGEPLKELQKTIEQFVAGGSDDFTSSLRELRHRKSILQKRVHALRTELLLRQREIAEIDEVIQKAAHALEHRPKRPGPHGKGSGGETLSELALHLLQLNRRRLTLTELARQILDWGYNTKSSFVDFRTNVAHALRRLGPDVTRDGRAWVATKRKRVVTRKGAPGS